MIARKPELTGFNPDFKITDKDCKQRKIDIVLRDLALKHWCNDKKAARYCVRNKLLPLDAQTGVRMILAFYKKIEEVYKTDYALNKYANGCHSFYKNQQNRDQLTSTLKAEIANKTLELESERAQKTSYNLRKAINSNKKLVKNVAKYHASKIKSNAAMSTLIGSQSSSSTATATASSGNSQSNDVEHDNLFLASNRNTSIGTLLKCAATDIHNRYKDGQHITASELNIMTLGLSSILDLSSSNENCQKILFTKTEWNALTKYFYDKYTIPASPILSTSIIQTWKIATSLCQQQGVFIGIKYLSKIKSAPSTDESKYKTLCIFEHVLSVLLVNKSLIQAILTNDGSISEQDVVSNIWAPIFRHLFSINNIIRIKSGETTNEASTINKKKLYNESNNITGFNIDMRYLVDHNKMEVDLASCEVAINAFNETKILHDESKVMREAKDICDTHIDSGAHVKEGRNNHFGWALQISGLDGKLSTVHLDRTGLYVSIPQYDLTFPSDDTKLDEFIETYRNLYTFVCNLEDKAKDIKYIYGKIDHSYSQSLQNILDPEGSDNLPGSPFVDQKRDSYYSPPRGDNSISLTPNRLYGKSRKRDHNDVEEDVDILEELREFKKNDTKKEIEVVADEFGWFFNDDDVWQNVVAKVTSTTNPYD